MIIAWFSDIKLRHFLIALLDSNLILLIHTNKGEGSYSPVELVVNL